MNVKLTFPVTFSRCCSPFDVLRTPLNIYISGSLKIAFENLQ